MVLVFASFRPCIFHRTLTRFSHQLSTIRRLAGTPVAMKEHTASKVNLADNVEFQRLLNNRELKRLIEIFKKNKYEIRFAGGIVRDLLDGLVPHDVDLATVATPKEMRQMLASEQVRMINEQGEKHGTVTARIE